MKKVQDNYCKKMFHLLAHLADIFKSRKKEKEDKHEPKVENLPPKYVQMIRQNGLKVLDFSSQYSNNESRSYAASNIAGPSSSFPNYGDFVKSFVLVCDSNIVLTKLLIFLYLILTTFDKVD